MNRYLYILLLICFSQCTFSQIQKNIGTEIGIYYPKFHQNIKSVGNITTKYYLNYEANINFRLVDTAKKIINTFLFSISTYNFHFKEYSSNIPSLTYYAYNDDSILVPVNIVYTNIEKDKEGYITHRGEEKINYVNINFLMGKTFSVLNKLEINILSGGMIGYRYYAQFRRIDMGSSIQELYINDNYPTDKANIILSLPFYTSFCFSFSKANLGIYAKTMFPLIGESSLNDNYSNNGPPNYLKPNSQRPLHNLYNYYAWGMGICFFYSIN